LKPQPKLNLLYNRQQIAETVSRLAAELNRDYPGKHPILIGVLKGSFMFLADLIRLLDFSLEVDFVRLSSYGAGQRSLGKIKVVADLQKSVKDKDVLVVEDIVDTGFTTGFLLTYLRKQKPASLRLCALTEKPSRRKVPVAIDYLGLTVPDKFIVGYGLDLDERFRNLPAIYTLED
jgi:hypoxanthine phosphoribosyltransferase